MHITKSELSHASSRTLELTAEATEFELATATASRRETRKYERMAWARVCGWMDGWMDGGINVCMKHMLQEYTIEPSNICIHKILTDKQLSIAVVCS